MSSDRGSEPLAEKRVLVTGAAGQLGGYLVPAVRRSGATAIALGSRASARVDIAVDLADHDAVNRAFCDAAPDIIIHGAAGTDVDGIERDPALGDRANTRATRNVAEASREIGAYLLAVSTDMVFPGDGGAPYAEDAVPAPISHYGRSKLAAEQAVAAANPAFAVARTAWLFGGAGKHFPRTVLTVLRDRGTIDVVDDEFGSPTFAGDLAQALVQLVGARPAGLFHLVDSGRASRFELARETAVCAGFDPDRVRPLSTTEFLARFPLPARRPPDSTLRNLRAADLGITLRHWQEAIAEYAPILAAELRTETVSAMASEG